MALSDKIGTDSRRVSNYETGKITLSWDAVVHTAQAPNMSIDRLFMDDIPRRPQHTNEHNLGDRLGDQAELSHGGLAPLLDMPHAVATKNRIKTFAGGTR
ncbi:MAG: hypothetical protein JWN00_6004 [Actinomycetia bacterium]|nr:hypothetical protein [Actinomycetes bacterium]